MSLNLRLDDLSWRELEGEIVVLDLRTSKYLSLNETASFIWTLLIDGVPSSEIVDRLVDEFAADRETVIRDLDDFVAELRSRGLTS